MADGGGVFTDGDWILSEDLKSGTDVRLIQLGDVGVGAFLDKSSKWISQQRFGEIGCTQLQAGDLLVSRMAEPLARACILPHLPHPAITAVDVSVLRIPAEAGVDGRWVMHALNSAVVRDQAERKASGTTRKRITRKKLGRVMVPMPPLNEGAPVVRVGAMQPTGPRSPCSGVGSGWAVHRRKLRSRPSSLMAGP